jgi:nucleotide-binding universal stress UspA family protein
MNPLLFGVIVVLLLVLGAALIPGFLHRRGRSTEAVEVSASRILFPYLAQALSARALEAALRLARAENATLVPVFLARVSMQLPLDTPLPRQCALAIPLQEAIEQRAAVFGVAVDARIERGRTYRHALRETIAHERFDRIVIAAATADGAGFGADDVAWLLQHAAGELIVLRPGQDEQLAPPPGRGRLPRSARPIRARPPRRIGVPRAMSR